MRQLEKESEGKAQPDFKQEGMTLELHDVYLPTAKQWKDYTVGTA